MAKAKHVGQQTTFFVVSRLVTADLAEHPRRPTADEKSGKLPSLAPGREVQLRSLCASVEQEGNRTLQEVNRILEGSDSSLS